MQIKVDRQAGLCYNCPMRFAVVLIAFLMLASSSYPQEPAPDTADTVYMPLDSLDAGIDLALRALKMNRGDLTFRGDYLEPDEYRIEIVDKFMLTPYELIEYSEEKISNNDFMKLKSESYIYTHNRSDSGFSISSTNRYLITRLFSFFNRLDDSVKLIFLKILDNIERQKQDDDGTGEIKYNEVVIDSVIEGFTVIIEENEEDEFLSVEELDSLSELEEDWAFTIKRLASNYRGKYRSIDLQYSLIDHLKSNGDEIISFVKDFGLSTVGSDFGQIIIGDTTDNHYTGDLFIVIDPGGNDTYDIEFEGTGHHTYIIDYGGDDTYNMPKNRISPYFFGSNMILDYDGDDLYNAGSWTLGAGLFGVGVLWDMKGNDRYYGDTFTMGAGCFGVGILRDDDGNDSYQAALFSQGFGFVDGVGVLIDNAGNDNYFAGGKYKDFIRYDDHYISLSQGFGYGLRPKMSGGVGMLIDKTGNDVYISDIFGQGASYWYGMGMLADGGGNDQYISFQYAQGNGTHMSLGILYDVDGDDVYSAKGVSQGCGHDRAVGMLIDLDGDDNYNAYDLCQGAGSANGLGLIADVRGKDVYIVRSDRNTQGYGSEGTITGGPIPCGERGWINEKSYIINASIIFNSAGPDRG
jgi:hypothetical protein